MDDFFNKVQDSVVLAGRAVSEKAKNVSDITKTKYDLSMKETDLRAKLALLGDRYFEENKDNEDFANEEIFEEIKSLKSDISDIKDRMRDLRNLKACPECGCEVAYDAKFCKSCGTKLY